MTTATLSLDAAHVRSANPAPPVLARPVGAVGACVSVTVAPEVSIIVLIEGTPFVSTIQSM